MPARMSFSANVLYTKHLTKKRKTYHDGSLTVDAAGGACLQDESKEVIARAVVPPAREWAAGDEGMPSVTADGTLAVHL